MTPCDGSYAERMTATLDAATGARVAATAPWRTRILPPTDGRGGWTATLLVGLLAGLLRVVRLDIPAGRIFDEVYYVCDAQNLLRAGVELETEGGSKPVSWRCTPTGEPGFVAHPPLGKWLIAAGIRLFGVDEFGWRIAAAVAGTLTVVVLVRVARRMTGSTVLACVAGLLLSLDGLHFVLSRTALLDVFLTAWVLAAFACLVADRDAVRRRLAVTDDERLAGGRPPLGVRPWRLAAGVCLGAAVATKWSGLYAVAALVLLSFAWEVGARRTAGVPAPVRSVLRSSLPLALGSLVVLPAAVYALSWAGWFLGDEGYARDWAQDHPASGAASLVPDPVHSWWRYHREIFRFHDNLRLDHPYASHPAGWLLLARPVSFYYPSDVGPGRYGCEVASCSREVLAVGTTALWWGFLVAIGVLVWMWVAHRDWRPAAVLAMVAALIVPWVRDDLDGRTMFLFYALPAVPFMCLGLALVAGWALGGVGASPGRRRAAALGTGVFLAVVLANFAWLYPVLAAQTLPYEAWRDRMLFSSWI